MNANALIILGLNPAWQKTLVFGRFRYGEVNRAEDVAWQASGKGVNAARALHVRGIPATVVQLVGGDSGRRLKKALAAEGIAHVSVATRSPTRVCTTVISRHGAEMTELIEPSGPVTAAELLALRRRLARLLPRGRGIALCGTCPPGVPDRLYADVIAAARGHALVLLDGYRHVEAALKAGPHLLKINRRELCALAGRAAPAAAARRVLARWPAGCLAVTDGAARAFLFLRGRAWEFGIAAVERVASPLGAGDCASGILLAGCLAALPRSLSPDAWMHDQARSAPLPPLAKAFALALAAASASCVTLIPGQYAPRLAAGLRRQMTVREIPFPWPS